jgi:diaminohydroxyphosphoribosylaminopyrimidine deaminase/5-amino-6-(5-phosphoribosylamino)uracil reductase
MELAISEMKKCDGRGPRVGVVIEQDGKVISNHRLPNHHAEAGVIQAALLQGMDLRGATLYSTLEPCVEAGSSKECCSDLIARVGIRTVYIGRYDSNPLIYRGGWKRLRDAGIIVRDFDSDLRTTIDEINATFAEHFVAGIGPRGGAKFDFLLNGGKFEIQYSKSDERTIVTQWTLRGRDSIYAYAVQPVRVALARYASEFGEIDDPRAFDFNYTVPVRVGEIAVFVIESGAALVKVLAVESGPDFGSAHTFLKIQYEIRSWT